MNVDAVVLDIDGVLVDVSDSYRRAIIETVSHVHAESVSQDTVQLFKEAGGFNNDWELTDALALYVLARREGLDHSIETFTNAIDATGGGLEAAQTVISESLPPAARERVFAAWDPDHHRAIFQQLYLGSERYRDLEGAEPALETAGLIENETVLLAEETIAALDVPLGILTGRPAPEASIALDRVGLSIDPEHCFTMDDWDGTKPDPDALVTLGRRFDADTIAFVGDTMDDMRTAVNANSADERTYLGIGVLTGGLSGGEGRQKFDGAGASAVIDSVNELPEFLSES